MIRKMRRDKLRKKYGNRDFNEVWEKYQKNKYGKDYFKICRSKNSFERNRAEQDQINQDDRKSFLDFLKQRKSILDFMNK